MQGDPTDHRTGEKIDEWFGDAQNSGAVIFTVITTDQLCTMMLIFSSMRSMFCLHFNLQLLL